MDSRQNHLLDVDDFRWGLIDFGVEISQEDALEVQTHFGQEGKVHWVNFLKDLKGEENWDSSREALVRQAYASLDSGNNG